MARRVPAWIPNEFDQEILHVLERAGVNEVGIYHRRTQGGSLRAIASCDPPDYKWHLSLRHEARRKRGRRYPTWEEVADAVAELLPVARYVMYLPPPERLAEIPDAILHIFQAPDRDLPKRVEAATELKVFDGGKQSAYSPADA